MMPTKLLVVFIVFLAHDFISVRPGWYTVSWYLIRTRLCLLNDITLRYRLWCLPRHWYSLKTKTCHDDNFDITSGTGGCLCDNLRWASGEPVMKHLASWQLSDFSVMPHVMNCDEPILRQANYLIQLRRIILWPSDAMWRQTWESKLAQVIGLLPDGTKPLP